MGDVMEPSRFNILAGELPVTQRLALSYSPKNTRYRWLALLALDARLARIVSHGSEPMLAQMRLAWWREELGKHVSGRPEGDALLDLIGISWQTNESGLIALIDGWEHLLSDGSLSRPDAKGFVDGRAESIVSLAAASGFENLGDTVFALARYWAAVDLLMHLSADTDRQIVTALIDSFSDILPPLPKGLRPLTVLAGLARHARSRDELELLGSRASVLTGIRLGLLGR